MISEGLDDVLVCHKPVARKGDHVTCLTGTIDTIIDGGSGVLIGGKLVACKGDRTAHGGIILTGCPRVLIGLGLRHICKLRAAAMQAAFIKYTVRNRRGPFVSPTAE
jgi:uncharacterized Zn-binding protein involved in type VI secretion